MSYAFKRVKSNIVRTWNIVSIVHLQYNNNIKGLPKSAKNLSAITCGVLNQVFLARTGQQRPQKWDSRSSRATKQKYENVKRATNMEGF